MRSFLIGIFSSLSSWWGLGLIAAMDSLIIVTLPLAVDVAVIVLSSRAHETFWVYPIIASIGSIFGAAVTFLFGIAVLGTALAVFQLIRTTRMGRAPRGRRVA